ncbi:MAG: NAD(+)/NADH kinase [Chlamydiia bacterium]|nr:NAD(+)/NADH kinase [Chlamydiia bacterium]
MKIALFPNLSKNQSLMIAEGIKDFLVGKGVKVYSEDDVAEKIKAEPLSKVSPQEINYRITLGGDGTILRMIHRHPEMDAPTLGINHGSLGFMADTPVTEIYPSLEDLLSGDFDIDERLMMEAEDVSGQKGFAVNEIVFHRSKNPCLVDLSCHIDGTYINTFSADGIILSTPNGSTAYSMAAGGPILTPDLQCLALTPICPHTISNRPIVLMPKEDIRVQYLSPYEPIEVTLDGFSLFHMNPEDIVTIRPSKKSFKIINLHRHDFYSTLRSKLGWSGKLKT